MYAGPFFSTARKATALFATCSDDVARRAYLPKIASGDVVATVGAVGSGVDWSETPCSLAARRDRTGWLLDGELACVIDGDLADVVFVLAEYDQGKGIFIIEPGSDGLTRTSYAGLDPTRRQARLVLRSLPARRLKTPAPVEDFCTALKIAAVCLASEQLGVAERALDASVAYAKMREQFGRPIGSFQAIKHKCADIYLEIQAARVAVEHAADALDRGAEDAALAVSVSKLMCSDAAYHAASENIQIHGGIGFTWEHDAHLLYRRAKASQLFLGTPSAHRAHLADRLGLGATSRGSRTD